MWKHVNCHFWVEQTNWKKSEQSLTSGVIKVIHMSIKTIHDP